MRLEQRPDGWYIIDTDGSVIDGPYPSQEDAVSTAEAFGIKLQGVGTNVPTQQNALLLYYAGRVNRDQLVQWFGEFNTQAMLGQTLSDAEVANVQRLLQEQPNLNAPAVPTKAAEPQPEFSTRKFAEGWAVIDSTGNRVSPFVSTDSEAKAMLESGTFKAANVIQPPSFTGGAGGEFYPGAGVYTGTDLLTAAREGKDAAGNPTPPAVTPQQAMNTLIMSGWSPEDALARLKQAGVVGQDSTLAGLAQLGAPATGGPPPTLAQTQAGLAAGTTTGAIGAPQAAPVASQGATAASTGNPWLDSLRPIAEQFGAQYGIPPEVLLAINASETNWGAAGGLNGPLFGIKGPGVSYDTHEVNQDGSVSYINDSFRSYDSPQAAYQDFFNLVSTVPRYAEAYKKLQAGDWQGFMQGINAAGYATDPNWATMITGLAQNITGGAIPAGTAPGAATGTATATTPGTGLTPAPGLTPAAGPQLEGLTVQQWAEAVARDPSRMDEAVAALSSQWASKYTPDRIQAELASFRKSVNETALATMGNPSARRARNIQDLANATGQYQLSPTQAAVASALGPGRAEQYVKETLGLDRFPTLAEMNAYGVTSIAGLKNRTPFDLNTIGAIMTPREGFSSPVPSDVNAIVNAMRQARGLTDDQNILSLGGGYDQDQVRSNIEAAALRAIPEVEGTVDDMNRKQWVETFMAGRPLVLAEQALKQPDMNEFGQYIAEGPTTYTRTIGGDTETLTTQGAAQGAEGVDLEAAARDRGYSVKLINGLWYIIGPDGQPIGAGYPSQLEAVGQMGVIAYRDDQVRASDKAARLAGDYTRPSQTPGGINTGRDDRSRALAPVSAPSNFIGTINPYHVSEQPIKISQWQQPDPALPPGNGGGTQPPPPPIEPIPPPLPYNGPVIYQPPFPGTTAQPATATTVQPLQPVPTPTAQPVAPAGAMPLEPIPPQRRRRRRDALTALERIVA